MESIKIYDRVFEVMISAERIAEAVKRVAKQINECYSADDRVVLLGILNGSFVFLSDLARELNFSPEISFVKVSSYEGCSSTGEVSDLIGLNDSLKGRNVLVVEDIIDTGSSITHIWSALQRHDIASAKICTLFFKPEAYRADVDIDFAAMEIGNEFIVGYGLDYNELGRELKDIYVTK